MEAGRSSKSARAPKRDSVQRTQRHHQGAAVAEPDHLARNFLVISDGYAALAPQAHRPLCAGDFHRQPLDTGDPAKPAQGGNGLDVLEQSAHTGLIWAIFSPES